MKKIAVLLLMAALLTGGMAWAESAQETGRITGMIAEITEDGFAMQADGGIVFVIVSDTVEWDTDGAPAAGDVATVRFSGPTDRKSVHADAVTCHCIRGEVTEVCVEEEEAWFMLQPEGGAEAIRVNLGEIPAETVAAGIDAAVYYDGIMTRSIPAQITAQYVRGTTLEGRIGETLENGDLTLILESGEEVILHVSEETAVLAEIVPGNAVRVGVGPYMTLSMPAQYQARDILQCF